MSEVRVAIHQPNLFPWLGFFDKMAGADRFIFLDTVPFTKGGYQHRVQIKTSAGAPWLTAPVLTKGKLGQLTKDVCLDGARAWRQSHGEALRHAYGKAPAYGSRAPAISRVYSQAPDNLVAFALPGIVLLMQWLGLTTPTLMASEFATAGLSGSALLADLVLAVGGTTYVSGPSGRAYLDEEMFRNQGVRVEYKDFNPFNYPQRFGPFAPGLSALDFVFNVPDAATAFASRFVGRAGADVQVAKLD